VPSGSAVTILVALSAVAATWGCSERVVLGRDGGEPLDARAADAAPPSIDATASDSDGARTCSVHPRDGITGLGEDSTFVRSLVGRLLVRGPYYWRSDSPDVWLERGHLAELWPDAPTALGRLPWDGAGVTALGWRDRDIYLISGALYWSIEAGEVHSGHVSELVPASPPTVDGLAPWDGEGVTGIDIVHPYTTILFSGPRFYEVAADVASADWIRSGTVEELWPSLPPIDGAHPWDAPGVTAYFRDGNIRVIVSGDRYWQTTLPGGERLTESGHVSERWADAPEIEIPCE
jgi:hypothetical protein